MAQLDIGSDSQLDHLTSLPYLPYLKSLKGWTCGAGSINGSNGILDGVSIVAGHEYAETVNDPHLNAYYDSDGGENGDKCAWLNLSNYKLANGYVFPMQPTWSNSWKTTYGTAATTRKASRGCA